MIHFNYYDKWILRIHAGTEGGKGPINSIKIITRDSEGICGKPMAPMEGHWAQILLPLMELLMFFMGMQAKG